MKCIVHDSGVVLMELSLFAPDLEQAQHMQRKMVENPSDLYGRVLDYVVCNNI